MRDEEITSSANIKECEYDMIIEIINLFIGVLHD